MQSNPEISRKSRRIDRLCDDFERAWKNGHATKIEDLIDRAPPEIRDELLLELVATELELRIENGEKTDCHDYLERFPDHASAIKKQFEKFAKNRVGGDLDTEAFEMTRAKSDSTELESIGKYKILRKIGQGGMGVIFEAQHPEMDRLVAIKVVSESILHEGQAVERFLREIRASAKLTHPNIVTAFDAGVYEGRAFLVMERLHGTSLDELVKAKGPVSHSDAAKYVREAAEGLAYIHGKSIVHRDVKPANLFLTSEGVIKVLDLGLAGLRKGEAIREAKEDAVDISLTEGVLGSPLYISPEQAAGLPSDHRADVYSLGCTLYFLLFGEPPFDNEAIDECLRSHIWREIPKNRTADRGLTQLQQVVGRMTDKLPDNRLQSMDEVIRNLRITHLGQSRTMRATSIACLVIAAIIVITLMRPKNEDPLPPRKTFSVNEALPSKDATWVPAKGYVNYFYDCALDPGGLGWAIGIGGTILETSDRGESWRPVSGPTTNDLKGVCVIRTPDDVGAWAVGHKTILQRRNREWVLQEASIAHDLKAVCFVDQMRGWAVGRAVGSLEGGGTILRTTDGGQSWTSMNFRGEQLHDVCFIDADPDPIGWVVGDWGSIYHSTDAGESWAEQDSRTSRHLNACYFHDIDDGWVVAGNGVIRRTTNGGKAWLSVENDTGNFEDICFVNPKEGWITGDRTLKTTDGGESWVEESLATGNYARGITALETGEVVVVGHSGLLKGRIDSQWGDRGITMSQHQGFISSLVALSHQDAIVIAGKKIRRTEDSGTTWLAASLQSHEKKHLEDSELLKFRSVDFCNRLDGWAVGDSGCVFLTEDGGRSFQRIELPDALNDVSLNHVQVLSPNQIWALSGPSFLRLRSLVTTNDGGFSWETVVFSDLEQWSPHLALRDLEVIDGLVCAVGDDGMILMLNERKERWRRSSLSDEAFRSNRIDGVDFINLTDGWVVGPKGLIASTKDGGATWDVLPTPIEGATWRDVEFLDANHGWIAGFEDSVGLDGVIATTSNGGQSWDIQFDGSEQFERLSFAGGIGLISSGKNIGVVWRLD